MPGPGITRVDPTPVSSIDKFGNPIVNPNAPVAADPSQGKIETPKPPEILAKEQELGHELEPVYATGEIGGYRPRTVEYGAPIGYRYDNGKSQYVSFDTSGQQTAITDRGNPGFADFALNVLSMAYPPAAPFIAAYRGAQALERGDPLSALAQLAGAGKIIPGLDPSTTAMLKNVSTGASLVKAVQSGDPLKIANSVANTGISPELKDVTTILNTANSLKNGDISGAFTGISKISDRDIVGRLTDKFDDIVSGNVAPLNPSQVSVLTPPTDEQAAQEQADRERAARDAARAAEPSGGLPPATDAATTDSGLTLPPVTVTGSTGNNTITDSALPVSPNVGTTDTNTGVNGNNVRTDSALPVNPNVGTTTDSGLTLPPVTVTGSTGNNTITDSALPVSPNVGTTDTNTGVNGNNVRTDSALPVNPNVGTTDSALNRVEVSGKALTPDTTDTNTGVNGNNVRTDSALPVSPNVGTTDPTLNRVEVSGKRLPPDTTNLTLPPVTVTGQLPALQTLPLVTITGQLPALTTTVIGTLPKITIPPIKPKTTIASKTTIKPTIEPSAGALPTADEISAPDEKVFKLGKMGSSEMGYNAHLKQLTLPERKELAMQADTAPSDVDLNKALAALAAYAPDAERDVTPEMYAAGGAVQRFAEGKQPDVQAMIDSYSKDDLQSALKDLGNIDTGLDQPESQVFSLKQVGVPSKPQSLQQMHVIPQLAALLQSRGMRFAEGGQPDHAHPHYDGTPLFRTGGLESLGGKYVEGKGDGTSDDIAAMLANGEYVFSADVVSALGNGSNKAGAKELDQMVQAIRARARSAPPDKLPPDAKSPLEYLKSSKGKKHG